MARAWAATRKGRVRVNNEDRCRVGSWRSSGEDCDWSGTTDGARQWAVVADGMGGHGAGDVASETAVDALEVLLDSSVEPVDLTRIIEAANGKVFEAMHGPLGRPAMGTTVAGMWIAGVDATIFNVGDSRVYLLTAAGLRMISVDHTPVRSISDGRRSHALTQSLGGTPVRAPLKPHLETIRPAPGEIVILCTDGLSDMIGDDRIASLLRAAPSHPAAALADAAVEAGGRDNVTVVVAFF